MEELLLGIDNEPLEAVLGRNAGEGLLFYSVSQYRRHLGLSESQVRYAIDNYRLDALFMDGEYRIPYTAILCFADSGWLDLSIGYLNAHRAADIEGVYDLNFNGEVGHVVRSLNEHGIPLETIPHLLSMNERKEYDRLPGEEEFKTGWYMLDELELPLEERAAGYARILGTSADWLCWKLSGMQGRIYRGTDPVGYPELLDLLVECEMVNFPIPVVLDFNKPPKEVLNDSQLYLF